MAKVEIDKEYVAAMLIEFLYEKGLVNKETYMNIYRSEERRVGKECS